MKTGTIFFCAVLLLAVGCAELPRPATFPITQQEQFQSATHWQVIAKRLVTERMMKDPDLTGIVKPGTAPRIFIETPNNSPFDEAYRNYLTTELINARFLLSSKPDDAPIRISWDHQLVSRDPMRFKPQGFPEWLGEALWEFFTGARWTTRGLIVSNTEIILTTWIMVGGAAPPIKSYSDTFYINDGDWANYQIAGSYAYSRSIAAQDEAWRRRLSQQGLLSQ